MIMCFMVLFLLFSLEKVNTDEAVSVCVSIAVIILKLGTVIALDMRMHHVLNQTDLDLDSKSHRS